MASLSCTLPIFLAVLGGSLATASLGGTLAQMVLYGLGMGLVISLLTLAVALFRESMQRWLKGAMRWVDPLGTVFLFMAGMYIVYYWLTIGGLLD
jgi:cytochrome c biogenesis protein CcdA